MPIFNASKNVSISELVNGNYQYNLLNKNGCISSKAEFTKEHQSFLINLYLNPNLFDKNFLKKAEDSKTKLATLTDKTTSEYKETLWWSRRPIKFDFDKAVSDAFSKSSNCKSKKNSNILATITLLEKSSQKGGTLENVISEQQGDQHAKKTPLVDESIIDAEPTAFSTALFSNWRDSKDGKFPSTLVINDLCELNSDSSALEKSKQFLLNYLQEVGEQFLCNELKFESGKSKYGFDENGNKTATAGKFKSILDNTCSTKDTEEKKVELAKKLTSKSSEPVDITASLEQTSIEKSDPVKKSSPPDTSPSPDPTAAKPAPPAAQEKKKPAPAAAKPAPPAAQEKKKPDPATAKPAPPAAQEKKKPAPAAAKPAPPAAQEKKKPDPATAKPAPPAAQEKKKPASTTAKPGPTATKPAPPASQKKKKPASTTAKPGPTATKPAPPASQEKKKPASTTAKKPARKVAGKRITQKNRKKKKDK